MKVYGTKRPKKRINNNNNKKNARIYFFHGGATSIKILNRFGVISWSWANKVDQERSFWQVEFMSDLLAHGYQVWPKYAV